MDSVDSERPLQPQVGTQLDPRDAVGRASTTAAARGELMARNNLMLNDPRRMGKTVWLDLFCADPGPGLEAVKIDYEGVHSTDEFLFRTARALAGYRGLPARALDGLRSLFDNLEVTAGAGPITIKPTVAARNRLVLLTETIGAVDAQLQDDTALVIAMDEVPIAVLNIAEREGAAAGRELLQTLRELRRRQGRVRWIVCGSVGMHHVIRRCETTEGAINDLTNLRLGPLTPDNARLLARCLLAGIGRPAEDGSIEALVGLTDGIPFLLHGLAHRLQDTGDGSVSAVAVQDAFADFLDDRDESRAVTHLVTRLEPYYDSEVRAAQSILDRVAIAETLASADVAGDAPEWVLNALVDDHYLAEHRSRLRWRYSALRAIWMHRRRLT